MKIIKKENLKNQTKFVVAIDEKVWKQQQDETFKNLCRTINVPGFRKGKVPLNVAKNNINENQILEGSLRKAVDGLYVKLLDDQAFDKDKLIEEAISVDVVKVDPKELTVSFIFENYPAVTLPDYHKIKIDYQDVVIDDKEVQSHIDYFSKNDTMLTPKEHAVIAKGDMVNFDFKGFTDGKPFPGGEAKNHELEIGSGQFIPGFEDQMIGLKPNDTKTIKVTFPKDYHAKDLAGKPADFEIKINDIKTIKRPELNDKFVEKLNFPNVKTVKELREFIYNRLFEMRKDENRKQAVKQISEFLIKNSKLDHIPETLLQSEIKRINEDTNKRAKDAKVAYEEYITKQLGFKDLKKYDETVIEQAKLDLTLIVAIEKIIEELKLDITDAETNDHLKKIADAYRISLDEVKSKFNNNFEGLNTFLINEKLFDTLININKHHEKTTKTTEHKTKK